MKEDRKKVIQFLGLDGTYVSFKESGFRPFEHREGAAQKMEKRKTQEKAGNYRKKPWKYGRISTRRNV